MLEVNVFDFNGDLYGKHMRVEFVRRLRGEKRVQEQCGALSARWTATRSAARQVLDACPTGNAVQRQSANAC